MNPQELEFLLWQWYDTPQESKSTEILFVGLILQGVNHTSEQLNSLNSPESGIEFWYSSLAKAEETL